MSKANFAKDETVYVAKTNITAKIHSVKWFEEDKAKRIPAGWRYEIDGARGLYYFEWQFEPESRGKLIIDTNVTGGRKHE